MQKILFQGGGNVLSNMSAYAIEWRGEIWMTAEHAYQSAKFESETIKEYIRNARSAYAAKVIAGENIQSVKENWLSQRLSVMEDVLRCKIAQHPHVCKKLLETGEGLIIEDTDDSFWGKGSSGDGQNHLGQLWMKLRSEHISSAV